MPPNDKPSDKELVKTPYSPYPIPQQYFNDEEGKFEVTKGSNGAPFVQVKTSGSYSILLGEPMPAGEQNDTLLEYDVATGDSKVYKYISGDWREL